MAASDVLFIGVLVFAAAIGLFIIFSVATTTIDGMLHSPINESVVAVAALDGTSVILFMFVYFIVVVFSVFTSTILSNVWELMTGASVFGVTLGSFPLSNHLMLLLPYYIGVVGFIGIVVMFAKPYMLEGG